MLQRSGLGDVPTKMHRKIYRTLSRTPDEGVCMHPSRHDAFMVMAVTDFSQRTSILTESL